MWRPAPRRRVLGLLAVGVLAASAGLTAHATGLLGWLERPTVDARFSIRGKQRPPANVIVVGLDNDSVHALPPFPFPRTIHARVLEHLHAAGARLVVYDISFDRPTSERADQPLRGADLALFEGARRAAPVVFATSVISSSGRTEVLGGEANLASVGDHAAAAYLPQDGDGVFRHLVDQVNGLPTIPAAVGEIVTGRPVSRQQLRAGWIDFRGPPGTVRALSFLRVLEDRFDPKTVRGKVVVVGPTAPVLQDLHSTAAGSPMSGPEVQANAIATVLSGFPLRSPSGVVTVMLVILVALLVPLAALRLGTLGVTLTGVAALALWSVATQLAFNSGVVLDYGDPLASLVLASAGTVTLGMWTDSRERTRLRMLFAGGTGTVVEQVLHPSGLRPLEPTAIIAGYRIEERIGRGGMGVVYRATQLALERAVAIKLIATDHAQDPVFRDRFAKESRIAASIEHPSVIPVYEAGEDDGLLFIAMRLIDGVDLAQLLGRQGALEPARAVHIIEQIAGALDAAHARGLVHRDIKPANVLLTLDEPERAYLTDFGVAKRVGANVGVTTADQWLGTLDYVAPEQIRGHAVDARADVYALTAMLYQCLTGQVPFPRDDEAAKLWAHLNAQAPTPSQVRADLPGEFDVVIARGMAKDPAERFSSAGAIARAAARALGLTVDEPHEPTPPADPHAHSQPPSDSAPTVLSE
jgi:CHASE2 domain-containing sensor protein